MCVPGRRSAARMAKVRLSPEADIDLLDIAAFGTECWDHDTAVEYLASFASSWSLLADHPHAGRPREDIVPRLRSRTHRSHVIFYYVEQDDVIIARVMHGAANVEAAFG